MEQSITSTFVEFLESSSSDHGNLLRICISLSISWIIITFYYEHFFRIGDLSKDVIFCQCFVASSRNLPLTGAVIGERLFCLFGCFAIKAQWHNPIYIFILELDRCCPSCSAITDYVIHSQWRCTKIILRIVLRRNEKKYGTSQT